MNKKENILMQKLIPSLWVLKWSSKAHWSMQSAASPSDSLSVNTCTCNHMQHLLLYKNQGLISINAWQRVFPSTSLLWVKEPASLCLFHKRKSPMSHIPALPRQNCVTQVPGEAVTFSLIWCLVNKIWLPWRAEQAKRWPLTAQKPQQFIWTRFLSLFCS